MKSNRLPSSIRSKTTRSVRTFSRNRRRCSRVKSAWLTSWPMRRSKHTEGPLARVGAPARPSA
ncbi:hypothetical protein [Ornithinimicrobium kibberense]|uniref:hypothetical protein n=1 Tax=Ornithinimicrobium kibberense TaxID=282060 RepID=UPI003609B03E